MISTFLPFGVQLRRDVTGDNYIWSIFIPENGIELQPDIKLSGSCESGTDREIQSNRALCYVYSQIALQAQYLADNYFQ